MLTLAQILLSSVQGVRQDSQHHKVCDTNMTLFTLLKRVSASLEFQQQAQS